MPTTDYFVDQICGRMLVRGFKYLSLFFVVVIVVHIHHNHNGLLFFRAQLNAYIQYTIITMHQSIDVMIICVDLRQPWALLYSNWADI